MGDSRGAENRARGARTGARVAVIGPLAEDAVKQKVSFTWFLPAIWFQGGAASGRSLKTQLTAWKEAMVASVYAAGIPVYVCRGNHEAKRGAGREEAVEAWREFFPEMPQNGPPGQEGLTYKVEHENATIIGFDQFIAMKSTAILPELDLGSPKTGMVFPVGPRADQGCQNSVGAFAFAHEMAFHRPPHRLPEETPNRNGTRFGTHVGRKRRVYLSGHDHLYVRRSAPDSAHRPVARAGGGMATARRPTPTTTSSRTTARGQPYIPSDLFCGDSDVESKKPPPTA